MTNEIASLDRVREAVETLRRRGVSPTADRVVELIGGSKTTVLNHMRMLRSLPAEPEELPPGVEELVRPVLVQVFKQGREAEAQKTRAATSAMSRSLDELDAQIAELSERNQALENLVESGAADLKAATEEIGRLEQTLVKAEREKTELQNRALADDAEAERRLLATLSKLEALIGTNGKDRKTLSLPNHANAATGRQAEDTRR